MPTGFIIMQIGIPELDLVCKEAIVPAIEACDLDAKRVDKHNEGGLLKSEIVSFISNADIIIADVTNERPNCYLEIGYAMGLDKFRNLIMTVREDHIPESPNYVVGGQKIHFDLAGYDILTWDNNHLPEFRAELEKRIKRRQAILKPSIQVATGDVEWITKHHEIARTRSAEYGVKAFMEMKATLPGSLHHWTPQELDAAARISTIGTFGWPIGVYLGNREDVRPKPTNEGIVADIPSHDDHAYDYWTIRRNGDFYFLGSLLEDEKKENEIFFNTRIARVTESLLYIARLYWNLGVDPSTEIQLVIGHTGLAGRKLTSSTHARRLNPKGPSAEDTVETELLTSIDNIQSSLTGLVQTVLSELFVLFEFFELSEGVYEDIVSRFVAGEVS